MMVRCNWPGRDTPSAMDAGSSLDLHCRLELASLRLLQLQRLLGALLDLLAPFGDVMAAA
jgi:hypothetical protein